MDGFFDAARPVAVNGTRLAVVEDGRGDSVVFVHGGVSDMRTWQGLAPALSDAGRVIVYSRRYARPNPDIPDGAEDPVDTHVEDLLALFTALDAAPAVLVGHSWGGLVALLAAIRQPEAVRGLVLMEPPALALWLGAPPRSGRLARLFVRDPAAALAVIRFVATAVVPARRAFRRGDDGAALAAVGRGILGGDAFGRLPGPRWQQVLDNRAADRAQLMGAGFPSLPISAMRSLAVPVVLLTGERSPALFGRLTATVEALLPDARRSVVPRASHIMHEDNPQVVEAEIRGFLARLSGEPGGAGR